MSRSRLSYPEQVLSARRDEFLAAALTNGGTFEAPTENRPFHPLTSRELLRRKFKLEWLVDGILVAGQPGVIGAPKKTLKSKLAVELAISLASKTPFLGRFKVTKRRRVYVFSAESGDATLRKTALEICRSKSIDLGELQIFWDFHVPALNSRKQRRMLSRTLRKWKTDVVIIDPLYLSLCASSSGESVNPANLFEIGPLLSRIVRCCLKAGATPIFVHHATKSAQFHNRGHNPLELEALSHSGVQEFVRQWLLVSRREDYDPDVGLHKLWLNIGGSAGFSSCWAVDVDEGRMAPNFKGLRWRITVLSRSQLLAATQELRQKKKAERAAADRADVLKALRSNRSGLTQADLHAAALGISKERVKKVVQQLLRSKLIVKCVIIKACGTGKKEHCAYKLRHAKKSTG